MRPALLGIIRVGGGGFRGGGGWTSTGHRVDENTNGLLRQYLLKRTRFARHTQADLDAIAHQLNGRPRKPSTS